MSLHIVEKVYWNIDPIKWEHIRCPSARHFLYFFAMSVETLSTVVYIVVHL